MLTFNLKKEWFDKIKSGEKTHEYREVNDYWCKRIDNFYKKQKYNQVCKFACGYPSNDDIDRILFAQVLDISVCNGLNTDLKINKDVFDIEFELIEDVDYEIGWN